MPVTLKEIYSYVHRELIDDKKIVGPGGFISSAKANHPQLELYPHIIAHFRKFSEEEISNFTVDGVSPEAQSINAVREMGGDSSTGYPKKAIMYVPGHYVLLNFTSENELEVYDSSNKEKSERDYPKLADWCTDNSVTLTYKKRFIQQPGSTDCATLSVLNAISLSLGAHFNEAGFVNPKSMPLIRKTWSLEIARKNLIPFVDHPTAEEIRAYFLSRNESRYMPRDEQLFHLYVKQAVEDGKSKDDIYEEMKAFCDSPEGKLVLEQSDAQSSGQPLLLTAGDPSSETTRSERASSHTTGSDSEHDRDAAAAQSRPLEGGLSGETTRSERASSHIPVTSENILNLPQQVEKATSMRNAYWGFTAFTLLAGASISWFAVSLVPMVIFAVISQAIYVVAIEDDYADALGKTNKPVRSDDIESGIVRKSLHLLDKDPAGLRPPSNVLGA